MTDRTQLTGPSSSRHEWSFIDEITLASLLRKLIQSLRDFRHSTFWRAFNRLFDHFDEVRTLLFGYRTTNVTIWPVRGHEFCTIAVEKREPWNATASATPQSLSDFVAVRHRLDVNFHDKVSHQQTEYKFVSKKSSSTLHQPHHGAPRCTIESLLSAVAFSRARGQEPFCVKRRCRPLLYQELTQLYQTEPNVSP